MEDNSEQVTSTQSPSPKDIGLVLHDNSFNNEESTQYCLETKSELGVELECETESRESETDDVIFPSKVKKNRNCVVLDSEDEDLMQEPEKIPGHFNEINASVYSNNDLNQSGNFKKLIFVFSKVLDITNKKGSIFLDEENFKRTSKRRTIDSIKK